MTIKDSSSIGVMTVATNLYLDYWKDLVTSAESVSLKSDLVKFFVFTDSSKSVQDFARGLRNVEVYAIEIPPYRWPEATLLRYKVFLENFEKLDVDILIHLDADMTINANPWRRIRKDLERVNVCLVRHPGFWRPRLFARMVVYLRNPSLLAADIKQKILVGGLGAWEDEVESEAFVPRMHRRKYFCGGVWFGRRENIHALLSELSTATENDLNKGIVAVWHDESHLNRWAGQNTFGEECPEMCFDETYSQLQGLSPVITAVRKTLKTR
jgi:hypothetical protein